MAFVIADRVRETTTTTGTGSVTLGGAYTSFQTFSAAIGNANNTYYTIASATSGEWEVGIGTYSSSGNLLSRDTVLSSSNGGSLVSFTSGTKDVFVTQPASRAIFVQNAGTGLQTGTTAFTASRVLYANATSTTTTSSNLTFDGTTLVAANFTDSSLTSGRVTYATTGGNLTDSANLTFDGTNLTLGGGTANGVAYLNGSKVLTTGSALTFNGTSLGIGAAPTGFGKLDVSQSTNFRILFSGAAAYGNNAIAGINDAGSETHLGLAGTPIAFYVQASEQMRLTSTGLGIGTSSPGSKLDVRSGATTFGAQILSTGTNTYGATTSTSLTNSNFQLIGGGASGATTGIRLSQGGSFELYFGGVQESGGAGAFVWQGYSGSAYAERMRLDSSGNLGLGVTPSAWSTAKAIDVLTDGGAFFSFTRNAGLASNSFWNGANWLYKSTGFATRYESSAGATGAHAWHTAPSGTAGNAITFTQAMTLDASGNLLVGTTSASGKLTVTRSTDGTIGYFDGSTTQFRIDVASSTINLNAQNGNAVMAFQTNGTERARITSGGYFKASNNGTYTGSTATYHESYNTASNYTHVFTNTNASPVGPLFLHSTDSNGTANEFWYCQGAAAQRAALRSNGGLANYSGNNVNLSDRREKTNFAPAKSYLDTICAIPVQTFNYIDQSEDDPGLTLGVVAQDVQAVAPELVMESNWGTEDTPKMRLSVYQTDLQYALMKALQELKSELDSVKAELATLKGA